MNDILSELRKVSHASSKLYQANKVKPMQASVHGNENIKKWKKKEMAGESGFTFCFGEIN